MTSICLACCPDLSHMSRHSRHRHLRVSARSSLPHERRRRIPVPTFSVTWQETSRRDLKRRVRQSRCRPSLFHLAAGLRRIRERRSHRPERELYPQRWRDQVRRNYQWSSRPCSLWFQSCLNSSRVIRLHGRGVPSVAPQGRFGTPAGRNPRDVVVAVVHQFRGGGP